MATKKPFLIKGGYNTSASTYYYSRPMGFIPFHTTNTTYQIGNMTTKKRDGSSVNWREDLGKSDTYRDNPAGIWYNGSNVTDAYGHRVKHKKAHYSYILCGYDPNTTTSGTVEGGNSAPVTNFSGIQFKWNTFGSHWSDSAIYIDGKSAMSLICYNYSTGKIYTQPTDVCHYSGRSPLENGSNSNVVNVAHFELSNSDKEWVRSNKIYLVGFMIQFYQKSEGGASHTRMFNMWDTQITYDMKGAGSGNMSHETYPYRMIMPDRVTNGIKYHGSGGGRSIKLYQG